MPKYVYPAIFTPQENGCYLINFPDVRSCFTQGKSILDGIEMAEDALAMMLCYYEKKRIPVLEPTPIKEIEVDSDSFVTLIKCDTTDYPLVECETNEE